MKMQFWNCLQLTSKSRLTFYIVSIVIMNMTGIMHVVKVDITIPIDTILDITLTDTLTSRVNKSSMQWS